MDPKQPAPQGEALSPHAGASADEAGWALAVESLTLTQVCGLTQASTHWVVARTREGLLPLGGPQAGATGNDPAEAGASMTADVQAWRFDAGSVQRIRRMVHIERTFDAGPELAALVADLHEEIDRLRAALALRQR